MTTVLGLCPFRHLGLYLLHLRALIRHHHNFSVYADADVLPSVFSPMGDDADAAAPEDHFVPTFVSAARPS